MEGRTLVSEANAISSRESTQDRLFRLAFEDVTIRAHRTVKGYWELIYRFRRGDEGWQEAESDCYELLSTEELVDVLHVVTERLLGDSGVSVRADAAG